MLTGCDLSDSNSSEKILSAISRFNDRVQMKLFSEHKLAKEYKESEITTPFPYNAFYPVESIQVISSESYKLETNGLVLIKKSWTLHELYQIYQTHQSNQITRHICVEGWSAIGQWGGIPLRAFLEIIGADLNARFVNFRCADGYYTSIDMESALHPQTLIALTWRNKTLPSEYGYPMKIRIPTKLGYKNPKQVVSIEVTNIYPGGYWEDQGYNWFGGS